MIEELTLKKQDAPSKAGIYAFYNDKNEIIYIGKAINIRARFCNYVLQYNEVKEKIQICKQMNEINPELYYCITDQLQLIVQRLYEVKKVKFNVSQGSSREKELGLILKYKPKYNSESEQYYDEKEKSCEDIAKLFNTTPGKIQKYIKKESENRMRKILIQMNKKQGTT